jgi:hypothetical protein
MPRPTCGSPGSILGRCGVIAAAQLYSAAHSHSAERYRYSNVSPGPGLVRIDKATGSVQGYDLRSGGW